MTAVWFQFHSIILKKDKRKMEENCTNHKPPHPESSPAGRTHKEPLGFHDPDDGNRESLDPFDPANERRKTETQELCLVPCSCSLQSGAGLSGSVSVPRQLLKQWQGLHPAQFGHFHQLKMPHRGFLLMFFFNLWHFLGMIVMRFLLGKKMQKQGR